MHPASHGVEVLSPKPGAPNLLVAPAGIVMTEFGIIFVVDSSTDQLVAIDSDGDQLVVETALGDPVNVGTEPFGLALRESPLSYELWVSARGSHEIRHLVKVLASGITSTALSTDARWAHARGIAVDGDVLDVAVDDGQGYWTVSQDTGAIGDPLVDLDPILPPVDESPGVPAWDVEPYSYIRPLNAIVDLVFWHVLSLQQTKVVSPGIPVCDSAVSRLESYGLTSSLFPPQDGQFIEETVELADGTPLRCPSALATGLDGALYATGSAFPFGSGAQVVRLVPGSDAAPTVVATIADAPGTLALPAGLAVSPVPEAGRESEDLAALAVLGVGATRRRRGRRTDSPRALTAADR